MLKLLATTVVRGSTKGQSHGGAYLVDLEARDVREVIDWNTEEIDWQGNGWDRGLRGVAFDGDTIYIAASEELMAFDREFKRIGAWRCPHLKHCHALSIYERNLYLASAGYDSIIAFDLDKHEFHWALHVNLDQLRFRGTTYDPNGDDGPLQLSKLHVNNVFASDAGIYISGMRSRGMLHFNGKQVNMSVTLPEGSNNARPFRNGALFNDTNAECLRYVTRDGAEDRKMTIANYEGIAQEPADRKVARPGFARGLCLLNDHVVASGSSPATVFVHDLQANETVLNVNFSNDARVAIHSLAVWPC